MRAYEYIGICNTFTSEIDHRHKLVTCDYYFFLVKTDVQNEQTVHTGLSEEEETQSTLQASKLALK